MTPHAEVAKLIRRELKAKFKGVKFSVRSESFSGGNAVRVRWEDGPHENEVEAITSKYRAGDFDGMNDMYVYSGEKKDHPTVKYVSLSRDYSDELVEKEIDALVEEYGIKDPDDYNEWLELDGGPEFRGAVLFNKYAAARISLHNKGF